MYLYPPLAVWFQICEEAQYLYGEGNRRQFAWLTGAAHSKAQRIACGIPSVPARYQWATERVLSVKLCKNGFGDGSLFS